MSENQKNISNLFVITLAISISIAVVIFETSQQYYYIQRYQLGDDFTFLGLFYGQSRKWLVWIIYAIPLWLYIKWLVGQSVINKLLIIITIAVIFALLFLVLTTISFVEMMLVTNEDLSVELLRSFFIFFTFQKMPIYSFGYTLLALLFYLFCVNNQLTVQLLKLSELNQKELNNYYQNQASNDQNTDVLKIKVGNSYKIVAVEDIDWIEADDYCVNIHNKTNETVYSMRATLKSLESILPESFLRVHRSAIVNMTGVQEYKTQGSGLIKMKSGDEIAVAQSKLKMVNAFFQN